MFLNLSNNSFPGFTYNLLSREFEWFKTPPGLISPCELVKWALACGHWSVEEVASTGVLCWYGPAGPTPWIGSSYTHYNDDSTALQVMRAHYVHWWTQRDTVKKAFECLEKKQEDETSAEKKPGTDFKLPDDTDPGFKGTEED